MTIQNNAPEANAAPAAASTPPPAATEAKPNTEATASDAGAQTNGAAAPAAESKNEAPPAEGERLLATEKKPEGEKHAEGAPKEGEKPAAEKKVPEKYELKRKENSALPVERVAAIEAEAKAKGLTNEEAQALLDRDESVVADHVKRESDALKERQSQWKESVASDKEMGGENQTRFVAHAHRVIERFGSPELKTILNNTELGNHPELVRLLGRVGLAIGEDRLVVPTAEAGAVKKATEEKFYDNTK